ncbi:MAG: glutamate racemase [Acidimicrobiia bacterium]|nr:glutamate racemase [Acidimicrobiia bacterium]
MTTIGVFDSGVGGLSVTRHLRALAPDVSITYLADQGYGPYGDRSLTKVRQRSLLAALRLLDEGVDEVVVACNTASAAALEAIRAAHPHVPIVGMEPAVKPAVEITASGVVAVLATEATFQGELYASLIASFGDSASIVGLTGTGLAAAVEAGVLDGPEIEYLLAPHVDRIHAMGADVIVLGCTHYPFLIDTLQTMAGPDVTIVDPAPAVARQAIRRLPPASGTGAGVCRFLTTGDAHRFADQLRRMIGVEGTVEAASLNGPGLRG